MLEINNKIINNSIKRFMDFDRNNKIFYINYYLDEYKIVLKSPIVLDEIQDDYIKIDNFDIAKYIYLTQID